MAIYSCGVKPQSSSTPRSASTTTPRYSSPSTITPRYTSPSTTKAPMITTRSSSSTTTPRYTSPSTTKALTVTTRSYVTTTKAIGPKTTKAELEQELGRRQSVIKSATAHYTTSRAAATTKRVSTTSAPTTAQRYGSTTTYSYGQPGTTRRVSTIAAATTAQRYGGTTSYSSGQTTPGGRFTVTTAAATTAQRYGGTTTYSYGQPGTTRVATTAAPTTVQRYGGTTTYSYGQPGTTRVATTAAPTTVQRYGGTTTYSYGQPGTTRVATTATPTTVQRYGSPTTYSSVQPVGKYTVTTATPTTIQRYGQVTTAPRYDSQLRKDIDELADKDLVTVSPVHDGNDINFGDGAYGTGLQSSEYSTYVGSDYVLDTSCADHYSGGTITIDGNTYTHYDQYRYGLKEGCGATAIAIALSSKGEGLLPTDVYASMDPDYRNGPYYTNIAATVNSYGYETESHSFEESKDAAVQNITEALSNGEPVIIRVKSNKDYTGGNGGHYIVLAGIDKNGDVIVLNPGGMPYDDESFVQGGYTTNSGDKLVPGAKTVSDLISQNTDGTGGYVIIKN